MKEKILTIIIPVYEYVEKLPSLLKSIDSKTCEVILIDDGSEKNKDEINKLFSFYKKYNHITTIFNSHLGIWEIRKKALFYVKTPYFTFADSDDLIFSKNLIKICQKMKDDNLKLGIGSVLFSINGFFCGVTRLRGNRELDFENVPRNLGNLLNTVWSKIYHVDLIPYFFFEQNLLFFEDTVAPYYIAMQSKKGYCSNLPVYFYQMRSDSTFNTYKDNLETRRLKNLYNASIYRKKAFETAGAYKQYQIELESIDIRLFLQAIQSVYRDKRIKNPKEVSTIILKTMTNLVPNWEENLYFQERFKTAELNDRYTTLMALYFLKRDDLPVYAKEYYNHDSIENLCAEYKKILIKKGDL